MNNMRVKMIDVSLIYILGIVCIVYCVSIFTYVGFNVKFHFIWFVIGLALIGLATVLKMQHSGIIRIPKSVWMPVLAIGLVVICVFAVVETFLLTAAFAKPKAGADYMIVLGCQVRGSSVSRALQYRLIEAEQYLKDNPDCVAILSGGQGSGEDISEAEAMYRWLTKAGIDGERLIKEEQSTSTVENIRYSKEFIDQTDAKTVVVSNGFHICRALGISKKQGLKQVEGLAGSSDPRMAPAYYLREFFAFIKDMLMGNLKY